MERQTGQGPQGCGTTVPSSLSLLSALRTLDLELGAANEQEMHIGAHRSLLLLAKGPEKGT